MDFKPDLDAPLKRTSWLRRKWNGLMFRWHHRHWNNCDQCSGTFRQYELCPTSGDWWLCPKCMDELLEEMNRDNAKKGGAS